jgi:hypothetical protein
MEIFAKQCFLDFVWLALPFAGMVAFRRFRLSAAEFAAHRRFKVQKRSQLFIRSHKEMLSIVAMRIGNESLCAH